MSLSIQRWIVLKNGLASLSQEVLFEKLQNYKKTAGQRLILQGEYDNYKKEILTLCSKNYFQRLNNFCAIDLCKMFLSASL
jgi:hypothetical protein